MTAGMETCPLCGFNAQVESTHQDARSIECRRCGKFLITEGLLLALDISNLKEADRPLFSYLSAYTRQAYEREALAQLDLDNWRDAARAHQTTPVSQKAEKLLRLVADRSAHPGEQVEVDLNLDYPLVDASSHEEMRYLLDYLVERQYLSSFGETGGPSCWVTVPGWEHLEPPAGGGGIPGRCFVAMSFHSSLNDAYDLGISAAIKDCGFDPIRIDRVHHNEKICDKILAEIRLAQFIVADFTHHRGGVYFEAGFAMGLGRPVIWTCQEDDLLNTHFDTRQYCHIVWSTPQDLRTKLADRIRATILSSAR
jgi:hypothetical protein